MLARPAAATRFALDRGMCLCWTRRASDAQSRPHMYGAIGFIGDIIGATGLCGVRSTWTLQQPAHNLSPERSRAGGVVTVLRGGHPAPGINSRHRKSGYELGADGGAEP